ncbi:MAG: pre-peptidase C-terminal domain-containing protein [Planctomycetales bacterium]|nr:pre-peptidase C-terminal domain-containing protein [Planctomycetales bacterium]
MQTTRWFRFVTLGTLTSLGMAIASGPASAQVPSVTSTSPQAVKPGETMDIKIRGGNLNGATQLWTSVTASSVLPTDVPNNGTNAAEVLYRLTVPADAQVGIHGLRVATATGVSNLKLFVVDELPSIVQTKPNQVPANAQALTIPCAVDGNVDSLVRDYYKFTVAAGQRVSFEVLARRLGAPLDPMIRIIDAKGRELAYSDDTPGIGSDPQLCYTFKDAGEYVLELRDIRYQGGPAFLYRLRIGDFPCVTAPFPMGIKKGAGVNVAFAGAGATEAQPVPVNTAADSAFAWLNVGAKSAGGKSSGFASVSVSAMDEVLEVEPNNEPAQSTRVNLGGGLNGRFDQPGDVDRFVFTAKTGQRFTFAGITRTQGSPTDLYLRMLKADGAEVAAAEDTGPLEGVIDYTFPADGDYTLVVEDLHRRGGPAFVYRVVIEPFQAGFMLAATADTLNIPLGGSASITVTSARKGYDGPIAIGLADAIEGLSATPTVIGPGRNSVVLTVQAAANAAPGKVYPSRIQGTATVGTAEFKAIATVTEAQKVAFSGLSSPPPALGGAVTMGVNPAPLFTLKTEPAEIVFGKDLTATVKVVATRATGFAEDIALTLLPAAPPAEQLPPGITAALKPIAKGTNEIAIVFTANNTAPLGAFSAAFAGTGKLAAVTAVQPVGLRLTLQAPYSLKAELGEAKVQRGQMLKGKVVATRNPAYKGPIVLTFKDLPKGVTAAAATIAEGQTEVEVVLTAAADAAAGAVQNPVVSGEGTAGAAKLPAASPAFSLTVME